MRVTGDPSRSTVDAGTPPRLPRARPLACCSRVVPGRLPATVGRGSSTGSRSARPGRVSPAAALSLVAVATQILLEPVLGQSVPFLVYFPAVVVAASVGGHWTGLTVVLCSLTHAVLFEAPTGTLFIADPIEAFRLGLFAVVGGVTRSSRAPRSPPGAARSRPGRPRSTLCGGIDGAR